MSGLLGAAALLCDALAVLCALACLLRTRDAALSLGVLLDLLLAAGLLRLAHDPTWAQLGTGAALVLVRRVTSTGLGLGSPAPDPTGRA